MPAFETKATTSLRLRTEDAFTQGSTADGAALGYEPKPLRGIERPVGHFDRDPHFKSPLGAP